MLVRGGGKMQYLASPTCLSGLISLDGQLIVTVGVNVSAVRERERELSSTPVDAKC